MQHNLFHKAKCPRVLPTASFATLHSYAVQRKSYCAFGQGVLEMDLRVRSGPVLSPHNNFLRNSTQLCSATQELCRAYALTHTGQGGLWPHFNLSPAGVSPHSSRPPPVRRSCWSVPPLRAAAHPPVPPLRPASCPTGFGRGRRSTQAPRVNAGSTQGQRRVNAQAGPHGEKRCATSSSPACS